MPSDLANSIEAFPIDLPNTALPFSTRLARENAWSQSFAERVIIEYKRFLVLCVEAGHPVTPSDEVDQAWHLHLCYTQSYWVDLCEQTIGRPIHHGPTRGGSEEQAKYRDWYLKTLASYERIFGEPPPQDIWPSAVIRFGGQDFRRIDRTSYFVVPKKGIYQIGLITVAGLLLAGCSSAWLDMANPFVFIVPGFVLVVVLISKFGRPGGGKGGGCSFSGCGAGKDSGDSGDGGCGSGCGGCGGD